MSGLFLRRAALAGGMVIAVTLTLARSSSAQVGASKEIVDNSRVLVYQTMVPGTEAGRRIGSTARDVVVVSIAHGVAAGGVRFEPRGNAVVASSAPGLLGPDVVVIELKDAQIAPLVNASLYPLAFPRSGVKKVLENPRVIVWDYTWTPDVPTPMHFHDKDVVVVYLADGALASTTPEGETVVNPHHFGFTKFNTRDRVHTEKLVRGSARAIIVELK